MGQTSMPVLHADPANPDVRGTVFEQYKLYVQMADQTTERRTKANTFFMTLHIAVYSGMWAFLIREFKDLRGAEAAVWLALPAAMPFLMIGLICICWWFAVRSYDQLLSKKFEIISELESALPARPYSSEWVRLGQGTNWRTYVPISRLDRWIPLIVGAVDLLTAIAVGWKLATIVET